MGELKKENEKREMDPFTRFMFGSNRNESEEQRDSFLPHPEENTLNLEELFTNFDALVDSAGKLKPLLQKVYPIVERIWKKN